jgi:serine/threonine protein kinase
MAQSKEDLEWSQRLGKGFFGEVWQAIEKSGLKRTLAVKKVKLQLITENKLTEQLRREINILYSLDHPRIIKLYSDFNDAGYMYLCMEFADAGSLFEKLNKVRKFPPESAARYFRETCEALDYLHHREEKVIHRDIKPENIMLHRVGSETHVKLADFGWANLIAEDLAKRETFCGTLDYLPPEMILGSGHDESADMWNMGVLLYELATGQSPFGSPSKEETCRLILRVDLRFPAELDADGQDLIAALCKKKPSERLDVRSAMKHKFLTKFSTDGSEQNGADVDDGARPSVVERVLQKDYEKINSEKAIAQQAKENLEKSLKAVKDELAEVNANIKAEQEKRGKSEAAYIELSKKVAARDQEIELLKKQLADGDDAGYKRSSLKEKVMSPFKK